MDDFREWLSDNLRYFMLGFGILAVVLILFFGVRFISSKFGNQKTDEPNRNRRHSRRRKHRLRRRKQKKHRQQPRNRKQHRQQESWN